MKAFKAMARPKDPRIVERECREIMQPYIRVIADIYARSTFSITVRPGELSKVTYPEGTEKAADEIRQLMQAHVRQHMKDSGHEGEADSQRD